VTVTAYDGANTASCQLGVTAYDPASSNGFAGAKTTCVSASSTPTPGSGGCPAGAAVLSTSSYSSALGAGHFGSDKQVLFKCGDTFTGTDTTLTGVTWSIGAYGGCQGTQTSRPIFNTASTSAGAFIINNTGTGDGRIADIDCEGAGTGGGCVNSPGGNGKISYQITLSNLHSNGNRTSYAYSQGAQWGLVGLVQTGASGIGTFLNFNENNPPYAGNTVNNLDYTALLGSYINGVGAAGGSSSGIETVRISACRMCVLENNNMQNSNNVGSNLKLHNGNTNNSLPTWTGVYTEFIEISDNWFGDNGGAGPEFAPQNAGLDERLRNIVFERNYVTNQTSGQGTRQGYASGVNMTLRDNIYYMPGNSSNYPITGHQVFTRGVEPAAQFNEAYNNTCYAPNSIAGQECIGFDGYGGYTPTAHSYAKNNMIYTPGSNGHLAVHDTGTGNTVSNNTVASSNNPGFMNGSGSFSLITDYKPTANYSGGTSVPVWFDALGLLWSLTSTWDLGAVHP
jgi:hypothetical protein